MNQTLVWIVPETRGGIAAYSTELWPHVHHAWEIQGGQTVLLSADLSSKQRLRGIIDRITALRPNLIHIQHEYGLFGAKIPGLYTFPKFVELLRGKLRDTKIVATAHSVLGSQYRYPLRGRSWETPLRWCANLTVVPFLRRLWNEGTWSLLDGVIVHSDLQLHAVRAAGCSDVAVIPHFVRASKVAEPACNSSDVVVFGYFTPEKAQDVVIRALPHVDKSVHLILAGGVRRKKDEAYFAYCRRLIDDLGLTDRVAITGYVADDDIDSYYNRAALVITPFRETSGSGSIAHAFARGAAILASDLPLNIDIATREHGALEFFRNEDPADCAHKITTLLNDPAKRGTLRQAALRYAKACAPEQIARKHLDFYAQIQSVIGAHKMRG